MDHMDGTVVAKWVHTRLTGWGLNSICAGSHRALTDRRSLATLATFLDTPTILYVAFPNTMPSYVRT